MGLFSGGFLGSGSDESSTSTTTTTNVTTETTTQVHDIGITGQNAVDLANVLSGNLGAVTIAQAGEQTTQLGLLNLSLQKLSDNALAQAQTEQAAVLAIQSQGEQLLSDIGARQQEQLNTITTVYRDTANPALKLGEGQQQILIYAIMAIAAIFIFGKIRR